MEELIQNIVNELGATSGAIMAPNKAKQLLYCYDSYNMPPEWVEIKNPFNNHTNVGNVYVYKTGQPVINNGFSDMFHGHYIESVLIVPIQKNGITLGTLEVIHSEKDRNFTQEDLDKATEFSKHVEIKH